MKNSELYNKLSNRLKQLESLDGFKEEDTLASHLEEKGVSRRDCMKWAAAMTAMLTLPSSFSPLIAKAATLSDRLPIMWLHMAECT